MPWEGDVRGVGRAGRSAVEWEIGVSTLGCGQSKVSSMLDHLEECGTCCETLRYVLGAFFVLFTRNATRAASDGAGTTTRVSRMSVEERC
jgi:hypothetical protein